MNVFELMLEKKRNRYVESFSIASFEAHLRDSARARALKDEDFSDNGTLHSSKELLGILHSSPKEVVHIHFIKFSW